MPARRSVALGRTVVAPVEWSCMLGRVLASVAVLAALYPSRTSTGMASRA